MTPEGINAFSTWLEAAWRTSVAVPPKEFVEEGGFTESFAGYEVDPSREFASRFELGKYLNERLAAADFHDLMAPHNDGLWAWLAAVYFRQLAGKVVRRGEHYIVRRVAPKGSLAYRHSARTAYELVHIHGDAAQICWRGGMATWGELAEQLTSRQKVAHNSGFFKAAHELYLAGGKFKKGAASKPKKPADRKAGDKTGFGGIRRLTVALQRLSLTYDTDTVDVQFMKGVLPKEFEKFY